MNYIFSALRRMGQAGHYLRHSGIVLVWFAIRALGQAATVVVLSRVLGADGYGRLVAILAIAALLIPFCGMGIANLLLRDGARDQDSLASRLSSAFRVWMGSALACSLVALVAASGLLPGKEAMVLVALLVASEIAAAGLVEILGRHEQACRRFSSFGVVSAGPSAVRLLAIGVYALWADSPDAAGAGVVMAISNGLVIATLLATFRPWQGGGSVDPGSLREAAPFAIAGFSLRAQAEFNKPVLAWNGFAAAGQFAAAQRMVDLVSLPLAALQEALWPRIYASSSFNRDFWRAASALVAAALAAGAAAAWAAPLLPLVLGPDFNESVTQVRLLALLPLLQVVRNMAAARLTHMGRTDAIGVAYAMGALVSIVGVMALVPRFSWHGAIVIAYGTECALIVMQVVYPSLRRHPRPATLSRRDPL